MQAAEDLGQLPVARHRVGDPRGADDARVRGDEEDRGGEDADVDLERLEQPALHAEVVDDAQDRVVREAALLGGRASSVVSFPSTSFTGSADNAISGSVK